MTMTRRDSSPTPVALHIALLSPRHPNYLNPYFFIHLIIFVCPPEGGLGSSGIKQTCSPMGLVLIAMTVRVVVGLILKFHIWLLMSFADFGFFQADVPLAHLFEPRSSGASLWFRGSPLALFVSCARSFLLLMTSRWTSSPPPRVEPGVGVWASPDLGRVCALFL